MKLHTFISIGALLCLAAAPASATSSRAGDESGKAANHLTLKSDAGSFASAIQAATFSVDSFTPDTNADGLLGGEDFAGFVAAWKHYDSRFDANGDGVIGGPDFAAFTRAFNVRFFALEAAAPTSMPEPSAALCFGIGAGFVAIGLRRRAVRAGRIRPA